MPLLIAFQFHRRMFKSGQTLYPTDIQIKILRTGGSELGFSH
ncbi:hypothetical protein VCR15J2_470249 [Vibrio coralliirubri]|nr:hypothetical protein VCR15J2_470249 [Vibrio coralliirubri]